MKTNLFFHANQITPDVCRLWANFVFSSGASIIISGSKAISALALLGDLGVRDATMGDIGGNTSPSVHSKTDDRHRRCLVHIISEAMGSVMGASATQRELFTVQTLP